MVVWEVISWNIFLKSSSCGWAYAWPYIDLIAFEGPSSQSNSNHLWNKTVCTPSARNQACTRSQKPLQINKSVQGQNRCLGQSV